jgi:SAM-dependent methyltransferase
MRHETAWLGQYLVAGVEDPRLNLQSILARHFLVRALAGETLRELMDQEYRFSAVMNWLVGCSRHLGGAEQLDSVWHALERGADNAEGLELPRFVLQTFATLPAKTGAFIVPNYIESFLDAAGSGITAPVLEQPSLNCFQELWQAALAQISTHGPDPGVPPHPCPSPQGEGKSAKAARGGFTAVFQAHPQKVAPLEPRPSVVEAACGSANDYRFLASYGIARFIDYSGFDLCEKNIENARALFPNVKFMTGNVFAIDAPDRAFALCLVQDLFEHLSRAGLEAAVQELCRVTGHGICAGFFQMDEIAEHKVRPLDDYYCNLLSVARTRELFGRHGFEAQVIHLDTFLRQHAGVGPTHNPNAYTFLLHRPGGPGSLCPGGLEPSPPAPGRTEH